jgi:MraZ protein
MIEQMFLGRYAHTFDEKGRIAIPTRFRDLLDGGAYLTQGFDKNLIVYRAQDFEQIYQQVNNLSITDPNARLLKRLIFANAIKVEVDKVGRILIPQYLKETVGLNGNNAVIVGVGDYFEIWSPEQWEIQNNQMQDSDTTAQRFAALNLTAK